MMRKIFVENGKARLLSFVKSPVFSHLGRGEWKVIASVDGEKRELETFTSVSARRIQQSMLSISRRSSANSPQTAGTR